jgi:hypothetical protein
MESHMSFLISSLLAVSLSGAQVPCSEPKGVPSSQRAFTNADLERMSACRYQTGVQSESGPPLGRATASSGRASKAPSSNAGETAALENDWRARWRSVDQRVRRLRREAKDLRLEVGVAAAGPRDKKKPAVTGRRAPDLLIVRAAQLEADARELEEEFADEARRAGALPGWLRPKGR